jgi:hypothetical protein
MRPPCEFLGPEHWPYTSATSCGAGDAHDREAVVADRPAGKLIKIGAKVVSHGRYVTFRMAEVAVSRQMLQEILMLIARLRAPPPPA